jgi:signal transduction histidine kinase
VLYDALGAALLALIVLTDMFSSGLPLYNVPAQVGLLLLQTLPLAVRRRYPLPVFAISSGAFVVQTALYPVSAYTLGALVATYTIGSELPARRSVGPMIAVAVAVFAVAITNSEPVFRGPGLLLNRVSLFVVIWALGYVARLQRLRAVELAQRAWQAESNRQAEGHRLISEERQRIARELHDVVTHHVTVIAIQAAAADEQLGEGREQARGAIAVIRHSARQALNDMRRMLGVLGSSGEANSLADRPGIEQLPALAADVRTTGLAVDVRFDGQTRSLDEGIDLCAYRIVQEALTNTLRHSNASEANVLVTFDSRAITLEVVDNGTARSDAIEAPHEGKGLTGLRQRAAMFDGDVEAGPLAAGGFRVWVRLPLGMQP